MDYITREQLRWWKGVHTAKVPHPQMRGVVRSSCSSGSQEDLSSCPPPIPSWGRPLLDWFPIMCPALA
jgi:hypothetical protein